MGGTSTDVALCQNGQPTIGRETTIGQFRIKVPSVNVHTVGAGGGSIAHVPELTKALRVGPQSAGAEPGPAAYGKGGDGADRHRRERRARPPAAAPARRRDGRSTSRPPRAAVQKIADAMGLDSRRGGRRGHPRDRQREHGRRAAPRLRPARPRPARVRARRLRRRRAAARQRGRGADGLVPGDRPAGAGPALRDRRPRRRLPRRVRADATSGSLGRGERRRGRGHPRRPRRAGAGRGSTARGSPRTRSGSPTWPTCATTGRATRSRSRSTPARCAANGLADLEERFNALHEQLYGFRMPGTASEIVNLRAVGYGAVPKPELPVGDARRAGRVGRRRRRARGRLRRRARARRRSTTARSSQPGAALDGPAIVTEFDSTTVVLPGLPRRGRPNFNILITPND